ncbi:GNAT family N-acetyltransferase [Frateuria defendens]|uniref:GNAT family N-acetyltransferase n=1 Tax=Frateuria defendens TaxID=2219559 RepID=UPI000AB4F0AF|nr:GNAT family N-acetyltransferase [Frateuria defendens]
MTDAAPKPIALMEKSTRDATPAADGVSFRPMTEGDLKTAYAFSTELHWPHRLEDWQQVFELGRGLVAERDGEIVGTGFALPWGEHYATVGLVIVAPHCRGRRIGQRIMAELIEGAGRRNLLLHATAQGRGLYERLGFKRLGEIRQHQGIAQPAPLIALKPGWRLRPAGRNDIDTLAALDARARGMPRGPLIERMLGGLTTAVMLDFEDQPRGYALMHRFGRGWVVGPVAAPDADGAKALIAHLVGHNAGKFTRIDVDFDSGLTQWIENLGLARVDAVTTMVRGTPPTADPKLRLYSLATQAFA